ncbi:MAG: hypothetical protein AAGA56_16710 [Myxococcota bacterium]
MYASTEELEHFARELESEERFTELVPVLLELARDAHLAGDDDSARKIFRRAQRTARLLGDDLARGHVALRMGQHSAAMGDDAKAEKQLRSAVKLFQRVELPDSLLRARIALGIFLQDRQPGDEGSALLEQAIAGAPPDHPDAMVAQQYLSGAVDPCAASPFFPFRVRRSVP